MKITLSQYEGDPRQVAFSCEMSDESKLDHVVEHLESLLRCLWGASVTLEWSMEQQVPGGLRSAVHAATLGEGHDATEKKRVLEHLYVKYFSGFAIGREHYMTAGMMLASPFFICCFVIFFLGYLSGSFRSAFRKQSSSRFPRAKLLLKTLSAYSAALLSMLTVAYIWIVTDVHAPASLRFPMLSLFGGCYEYPKEGRVGYEVFECFSEKYFRVTERHQQYPFSIGLDDADNLCQYRPDLSTAQYGVWNCGDRWVKMGRTYSEADAVTVGRRGP